MATIEIPRWRQESTVLLHVKLKDNGVAVDWTSLSGIRAYMYSDAQRVIAGRFDVSINGTDSEVLDVTYAATKPQYLGQNSLLVRCAYQDREKSFDIPVGVFVERTAQATGVEVITDPEADVTIEVDEVSTSLLDGAIAAALDAAVKAEEAAALVPLQVLEDCVEATENAETATAAANEAAEAANAAGITSVQASVADNEPGTPSVEVSLLNKVLSLVFHHLKGLKGDTGATPNITVGTVSTGAPGTPVVITMTGTAAAPVLNITIPQGLKGDKGDQGNTGSSVDFPYELVNNLTTNDATKGLSAAQGVVLDGKISQLDQEINGAIGPDTDITPTTNTGYWYQVNQTSISIQTASSSIYSGTVTAGSPPTGPTDGLDISAYIGRTIKCTINGAGSSSNRATIIADQNNSVLSFKRERDYVADGTKYSITMEVPANAKYLYFSGSSAATGLSIKVIGEYEEGLVDRLEYLGATSMKKSLKVLNISSSFGVNTFVQFPALAVAGGVDVVCGQLYSGSASLADIVSIINGTGNFQYGRLNTNGTWKSASANIATMLGLYDWDIIILQRAAPGNTGGSDTWTTAMADELETIIQYIAAHTTGHPKIMFNSYFARPVGKYADRAAQVAVTEQIMATAKEMQEQFGVEVIPSGIAIQNARSTSLAYVDTVNTSGYDIPDLAGEGDHLDTGVGSYILGCLLYEQILGNRFDMSVLEQTTVPTLANVTGNGAFSDSDFTQITAEQARIARYAAMCAVREPWTLNTALAERFPYPSN